MFSKMLSKLNIYYKCFIHRPATVLDRDYKYFYLAARKIYDEVKKGGMIDKNRISQKKVEANIYRTVGDTTTFRTAKKSVLTKEKSILLISIAV